MLKKSDELKTTQTISQNLTFENRDFAITIFDLLAGSNDNARRQENQPTVMPEAYVPEFTLLDGGEQR